MIDNQGEVAGMLRRLANYVDVDPKLLSAVSLDDLGGPTRKLSGECELEDLEPRILAEARAEYSARRQRSKFLDDSLLGEPGWDILLDLLIHRLIKKRVSVTSVCLASDVPPTTALRWIKLLCDKGLLVRSESVSDKRRAYIELSDEGWTKMRSYFVKRK